MHSTCPFVYILQELELIGLCCSSLLCRVRQGFRILYDLNGDHQRHGGFHGYNCTIYEQRNDRIDAGLAD